MAPSFGLPIRAERLLLRELTDSDFDAVHAYATDPEAVRYMPWGPNSEADTRAFLERARSAADVRPRVGYELAVTLRDTGDLVGAIGLHREETGDTEAMLGSASRVQLGGEGMRPKLPLPS